MVKRVADEWVPEIVSDIVDQSRRLGDGFLEILQTTAIAIATPNRRRYPLPADFDDELSVTLLDGDTTGTAQDGDSSVVTLDSAESISSADAEGRYVLMTAGTSKGQYRQITDYNSTTKEATVEQPWDDTKTPVSGDTYVILDCFDILWEDNTKEADKSYAATASSRPASFSRFNAEYLLDYPPDKAYGLKLRYYANPLKLDFADSKWTQMLSDWRSALIDGVTTLALEENDDSRSDNVRERFIAKVGGIVAKERPFGDEFEGVTL
tara:strand:- start:2295 stop:3092 length:798 start_codon:yes stop_codon:yes gene_type:complete